jgi:Fe-S-cluster containining protein
MDPQCAACKAKCCQYFCFQIDKPDTYEEFENIRWYLNHQGVSVHVDEGNWYMAVANPCKLVGADGRCTVYEARPLVCRKYSQRDCDYNKGEYEYQAFFEDSQSLEEYARQALGPENFDRARAAELAKLTPKTGRAKRHISK